ncbi:MAG: endonuclease/exonuclease/phosphatase family protein [Caldilineaceae bacterium]
MQQIQVTSPQQLTRRVLSLLLAAVVITTGFQRSTPVVNPKADQNTILRVLTWNAYFRNSNLDALAATVTKQQPDVIALQELGSALAAAISTALRDDYPYQELYPTGSPSGMGILSRYPFLSTTAPDYGPTTACNCQVVQIDFHGQPITVINAHPWPPKVTVTLAKGLTHLVDFDTAEQSRIFDQLLLRIQQTTTPLLVLGDLNTMPFQANVQQLRARLHDTWAETGVGAGNTFPAERRDHNLPPFPFIRIDYIFHDDHWLAHQSWVDSIAGSDHRSVGADLELR